MSWQRRMAGGALGFVGFMLSPLSWWNDAFVNVPLAVGAAWLVALAYPPAFPVAVVVAYWLSNVLGLVLLHKGAQQTLARQGVKRSYTRRDLARDLGVSLAYTLLIVVLLKCGALQPLHHYLDPR